MADDLENLILTISADTRQIQRALKRLEGDTTASTAKMEKAFDAPTKGLENLSKAMGKSQFQTANLAAQFQDIAVQLSGGQSPFQVALQQGTQISSVLGTGQGGAGGVVKQLGGAFLSLVSPISLATVGIIALGGAALQYIASSSDDVKTLDDALKEHADLIKQIKGAYGEAAEGVDAYSAKSAAVLETQIRANIVALQAEIEKAATSIVSSATKITPSLAAIEMGITEGVSPSEVTAKYGAFSDALRRLQEETARGEPNIRAFRDAVASVAVANPGDAEIQKLANAFLAATEGAAKAEGGLNAASRAIVAMREVADGTIGKIGELNSALKSLANIGLPNLTDRQKALAELQKGIASASGAEERRAAQSAYDSAVGRIGQREAEEAAEKARREAERNAARGARSGARVQGRVTNEISEIRETAEALELEFQMLGKTNAERAKARAMLELHNLLAREGITLTAEQAAEVDEYGNRVAAATENLNKMAELNQLSRELGSTLSDAFKDAVIQGEEFDQVLKKLLHRLASRAIDSVFNSMFAAPSGGGQSPFASLLSGIGSSFGGGRAGGGSVSANRPYLVGERGPEIVVPRVPGTVVPNNRLGGNVEFNVEHHIHNNGNANVRTEESRTAGGMRIDTYFDQVAAENIQMPGTASNRAVRMMGSGIPLTRR